MTGVHLKDVDDLWLAPNGRSLDMQKIHSMITQRDPRCDVIGLLQFGAKIFKSGDRYANVRQVRDRLGLTPGHIPSSYYHANQLPLGENGTAPILYFTVTNSLRKGCENYEADVDARRTANQSGLWRGPVR